MRVNTWKYKKPLEDQNTYDSGDLPVITIVIEKSATMTKHKSQEHNFNACEETIADNKDQNNHIEAKHNPKVGILFRKRVFYIKY